MIRLSENALRDPNTKRTIVGLERTSDRYIRLQHDNDNFTP